MLREFGQGKIVPVRRAPHQGVSSRVSFGNVTELSRIFWFSGVRSVIRGSHRRKIRALSAFCFHAPTADLITDLSHSIKGGFCRRRVRFSLDISPLSRSHMMNQTASHVGLVLFWNSPEPRFRLISTAFVRVPRPSHP